MIDFSTLNTVAVVGECMLELGSTAAISDSQFKQLAYGGDTLNTAHYLAQLSQPVSFISALGDDKYSEWMLKEWQRHGVDCQYVEQVTGRVPGLYMIENDVHGERSFYYWRDQSPACEILNSSAKAEAILRALQTCDVLYFSGVTLSLFNEQELARWLDVITRYRAGGGVVVFDSNFRPARWPNLHQAKEWFVAFYQQVDLALPTLEDDELLFEIEGASTLAALLEGFGVREFVIKNGAGGCFVPDNEGGLISIVAQHVQAIIDTTGAGDSFNAGYLAGRLQGERLDQAARSGHRLAAQVVQQSGAIIDISAD